MTALDAHIVGAGMVAFAKHPDVSMEDLGLRAVVAALNDAGVDRTAIDETFCGTAFGGSLLGQRILRDIGMTGMPISNVENACSSGATALREAVAAVSSGRIDTALVIGIDKLTDFGGGTIPLDGHDLEANHGVVMPAVYAMRARRYMHDHGLAREDLAAVVVKAHECAVHNPYAQYRNVVSVEEVLGSRMVADPLSLFMCCPTGDGAAAVVVCNGTGRARAKSVPVRVVASALQSGRYDTGYKDMAFSELTQRTARIAYDQAGVGPGDVDIAEVHDAFAIAELMYYDALGFCEPGGAVELIRSGATRVDGSIAVNPSGGLLCRGHPVGATGIAQVCEVLWHLRGAAGGRQVTGARVGLTHCTGGGISGIDHGACSIHILAL
ncbi:MAG: thiolase family protein [Solirubrobacteraceae bacterium]